MTNHTPVLQTSKRRENPRKLTAIEHGISRVTKQRKAKRAGGVMPPALPMCGDWAAHCRDVEIVTVRNQRGRFTWPRMLRVSKLLWLKDVGAGFFCSSICKPTEISVAVLTQTCCNSAAWYRDLAKPLLGSHR